MSDLHENQDNQSQSRGILGDVRSVKNNGAASLSELREFIGSLKGRKPQDVMGEVASNGLVQGVVYSTVGFLVILLVFTAIPYWMTGDEPVIQKQVTPAVSTPDQQSADASDNSNADERTQDATTEEGGPTGDAVLDNLGIGETKEADPEENPLGDKFNDLLEGVK
ncbi:MAG: hypothetical protein CMJ79_02340 [Planctomycetaceae bacterium]|nr:hypothetical protein [Planctomycetaceae bacterium]|tara:strand:- start:925 stop:1422 length:498 start_codon:yes stop_codon:yes gene_type:complete